MKVVLAGGSGFLGNELTRSFLASGDEVVHLSRTPSSRTDVRTIQWDAKTVGPWAVELGSSDVLINLCGASLLRRWNLAGKRQILDSRVDPTTTLGAALSTLLKQPSLWINASAVGFYGDRGDETLDESSAPGTGFLSETASVWEEAQLSSDLPHVRLVQLRIGLPFSSVGGAFPTLERLTKWFLGSPLGNGNQWWPWIHIDDLTSAVRHIIDGQPSGPVNLCAPNPVRNRELMAMLRAKLSRPWVPNVPAPLLRLGHLLGGPPPEAVLCSTRAVPRRLLDAGFEFGYPILESALDDLLGVKER